MALRFLQLERPRSIFLGLSDSSRRQLLLQWTVFEILSQAHLPLLSWAVDPRGTWRVNNWFCLCEFPRHTPMLIWTLATQEDGGPLSIGQPFHFQRELTVGYFLTLSRNLPSTVFSKGKLPDLANKNTGRRAIFITHLLY